MYVGWLFRRLFRPRPNLWGTYSDFWRRTYHFVSLLNTLFPSRISSSTKLCSWHFLVSPTVKPLHLLKWLKVTSKKGHFRFQAHITQSWLTQLQHQSLSLYISIRSFQCRNRLLVIFYGFRDITTRRYLFSLSKIGSSRLNFDMAVALLLLQLEGFLPIIAKLPALQFCILGIFSYLQPLWCHSSKLNIKTQRYLTLCQFRHPSTCPHRSRAHLFNAAIANFLSFMVFEILPPEDFSSRSPKLGCGYSRYNWPYHSQLYSYEIFPLLRPNFLLFHFVFLTFFPISNRYGAKAPQCLKVHCDTWPLAYSDHHYAMLRHPSTFPYRSRSCLFNAAIADFFSFMVYDL